MAKVTKIKVSSSAVRQILQSDEVQADLQKRTRAIANAAGGEPDFKARVEVRQGSSKLGRAMGFVTTATRKGRKAEAEDRKLTRAIGAGR
ncbi:hypothetical protein [Herbiconiux solani]|uniref:hypothetical protein n=1 Tax=Herbiconiux solani TaxID=661329 RepID=UPI0008249587|nr:hypothetical protein [Herbiconiux solani]